MPQYQMIFLEVPTLAIVLWVALRISLLEKRLGNVEKQLKKGGSVSLSLDPHALADLGRKMSEEKEKEKPAPEEDAEKEEEAEKK